MPRPSQSASGRVLLRMPTALHADLIAEARDQGVSLNHLMVALLAGSIGFKLKDGAA